MGSNVKPAPGAERVPLVDSVAAALSMDSSKLPAHRFRLRGRVRLDRNDADPYLHSGEQDLGADILPICAGGRGRMEYAGFLMRAGGATVFAHAEPVGASGPSPRC